jgi:hypothetical protein
MHFDPTPNTQASAHLPATQPQQREIGPASPSTASRRINPDGKFRARGFQRGNDGRRLDAESKLENDAILVLRADRRVRMIEDQPPFIRFVGPDGQTHRHTFDLRITLESGERIAAVIKPSRQAQRPEFVALLAHLKRDLPPDFADDLIHLSEVEISSRAVADAALILDARRIEDPEADRALDAALHDLHGSISIGDLANRTKLAGRCFAAAIRSIDDGRLVIAKRCHPDRRTLIKTVGDLRLNPDTLVRKAFV